VEAVREGMKSRESWGQSWLSQREFDKKTNRNIYQPHSRYEPKVLTLSAYWRD
jgi:hypothetical protein